MGRAKAGTKKPKDPNRPKRSTSAYFFFLAACREEARRNGRSISKIAEFTKDCSLKWKEMTPSNKKVFEDKALADKARYEREMELYGGGSKKRIDPTKPKRPQSAYFVFLGEFRTKTKDQSLDHKDILRKAGETWRNLTEAQKMPYEKKSQELQKIYEVQMEKWRKGEAVSNNGAAGGNDDDDMEDDDEEEDDDEDDDDDE